MNVNVVVTVSSIPTPTPNEICILGDDDRSVVRSYDLVHQDQFYDSNTTNGFFHHQFSGFGSSGQAVDSAEIVTVNTTTVMETTEYLDNLAKNIYRPSSPQIVREVLTQIGDGSSGFNDQLVYVRYLQPPEVPPPGVIRHTHIYMFINTI